MECVGFHVCGVVAGALRSMRQPCVALGQNRQAAPPAFMDSVGRAEKPRTGSWGRPVLQRWERNPQIRGRG